MESNKLIRHYLDILAEKAKSPYQGSEGARNIQALNPEIKNINRIQVGQKIRLPGQDQPYVVQAGDTLDKIAMGMKQSAPASSVVGSERRTGSYRGYPYTVGSEADLERARRLDTEPVDQSDRKSDAPELGPMAKQTTSRLDKPAAPAGRIQPNDQDRLRAELVAANSQDTDGPTWPTDDEVRRAQERSRQIIKDLEADIAAREREASATKDVAYSEPINTGNIEIKSRDDLPPIDGPTTYAIPDINDDDTQVIKEQTMRNPDLLRRYIDILAEAETSQVAPPTNQTGMTRRVTVNPDGTTSGGFKPTPADPNAPVDPKRQARMQRMADAEAAEKSWLGQAPKGYGWGGRLPANLKSADVERVLRGENPDEIFLGRSQRGMFGPDATQHRAMAQQWLDWQKTAPPKYDPLADVDD